MKEGCYSGEAGQVSAVLMLCLGPTPFKERQSQCLLFISVYFLLEDKY